MNLALVSLLSNFSLILIIILPLLFIFYGLSLHKYQSCTVVKKRLFYAFASVWACLMAAAISAIDLRVSTSSELVTYTTLTILVMESVIGLVFVFIPAHQKVLRIIERVIVFGIIYLTMFTFWSYYIAKIAYEIGRYSNYNPAAVQQNLQRNPDDPAAHFNMANIYLMHHRDMDAILEFQQVVRLEPPNNIYASNALFSIAELYRKAGQQQKSLYYFRLAAQRQDDYGTIARHYLALNHLK